MPTATANGIELAYETFGDKADRPLLLIMGLGAQMITWDERFCELLAERGFFVARFDNRDTGLSAKIEDGPRPNLLAAFGGDTSSASYTLEDMADDAAGLLDVLGIRAAHIVGASMGGMIAQTLAIRHPDRVLTLTSIMSTTGDMTVGQPTPEMLQMLFTPPPSDREGFIEATVRNTRAMGSTGFPFDEDRAREHVGAAYDRCYYPIGVARQLLAIAASGDRTAALRALDVPALVIHGEADPLVTVSGGEATAKAIPGAELLTVPGMGHDLPEGAWPMIIERITALAEGQKRRAVNALR